MKAIVVVGMGFGDEGKGSVVDCLARKYKSDLGVRYNGGHQAAHNVHLHDGRHHTFRQFGSGSFSCKRNYIGPKVIIEPFDLEREAKELSSKGIKDDLMRNLFIHEDTLITTPWHALLNRVRESLRENRHGSCGKGIGETRKYWIDYNQDAITYKDLEDYKLLIKKLGMVRERLLQAASDEMASVASMPAAIRESIRLLVNDMYDVCPYQTGIEMCNIMKNTTRTNAIPAFDMAIFEGAQGVLLDEWYGFHPHTTWSTTTTKHADDEIEQILRSCGPWGNSSTKVGVIRPYHTRHGRGPFPSELRSGEFVERVLKDDDNHGATVPWWQGPFRVGKFDRPLFNYAMRVCPVDKLFVTCLDHLSGDVVEGVNYRVPDAFKYPIPSTTVGEYNGKFLDKVTVDPYTTNVEDFCKTLGAPVMGYSHGKMVKDKVLL